MTEWFGQVFGAEYPALSPYRDAERGKGDT